MKPGEPFSPYRMFLCAPVPLALMTLQKVSAGAKLLFGRLMLHAGEKTTCYPGLDCLARELGVSIDTVSRWMRELIDGEFIRRRRRGPGMNAECEFIWHPDLAPSLAGDDSAGPGNQDSAKLRNQEADSAKSQRPPDSAEVGCKIPQNRGADSADSRSDYK